LQIFPIRSWYRECGAAFGRRSVGTAQSKRKGRHFAGRRGFSLAQARPARHACDMPSRPSNPVRQAVPADLEALLALEQASFQGDRISRAQWRRHIGSATATVLVIGAATAGLDAAAVVFHRRHSRSARLYSLAVAARARGAGLGNALLMAAEADARARGCEWMRLEVRVDNVPAIALYEHRGYVRGNRIPAFYEDRADAWRYMKRLTTVSRG
jgi:ribosomal protein S18 acetylase RimI-like enzyme